MSDLAQLQISVDSTGVGRASSDLDRMTRSGQQAESSVNSLSSGMASSTRNALAMAAAIGGITLGIGEFVRVAREFDKLNAGLITATGSAEKAKVAFDAISDFAKTTPYDLQQTVEAFTKLVNYGLEPSERALRSYGNTASSLGKPLMQMIEAVADAATGEFERLKEFGIKAKKSGDDVQFTFRGISTTVKNTSSEIEQYLMKLGETNFGDAMANRMATLDGALSNLGDSWTQLQQNIAQAGVGDAIKDSVTLATGALDELNAQLASGQMQGYLDSIKQAWSGWSTDVRTGLTQLSSVWTDHQGTVKSALDFIIGEFARFPENVRAGVQIIAVELATLVEKARAYGSALGQYLNPETYTGGKGAGGVTAALDAQLASLDKLRVGSIEGILQERNTTIKAVQDKVKAADEERVAWDKVQAAKKGLTTDRLAGFRIAGDNDQSNGKKKKTGKSDAEKEAERSKRDFDKLVESLRTEEEAINVSYKKRTDLIVGHTQEGSTMRSDLLKRSEAQYQEDIAGLKSNTELDRLTQELRTEEEKIGESYKRRLEIIRSNTEEGSSLRADLESRALEMRDNQQAALEERDMAEIERIRASLLTEEQELQASYDRKREIILNNEMITEQERQQLMMQLTQQYQDQQAAMEMQRQQQVLQGTGQLFKGLTDVAGQFAGKQSGIYKAMFAVSKAFAIADAVIKIQQGIASAASLPFPANLPAMASVAAATMGIVSTISSTNFSAPKISGAYDKGGMIPAGSYGLVGEIGPELVRGPAIVTGRRATAEQIKGSGGVVVNVINNAGVSVTTKEQQTPDGISIELVIEQAAQRAEGRIASGIAKGEGLVTKAMEGVYPLRRGAK